MTTDRRQFIQSLLAFSGALVSPLAVRRAFAAAPGRVLIGSQVAGPAMQLVTTVLTELQTRYRPDLGTRPVVMPGSSGSLAATTVLRSAPDGATVLMAPSSLATLLPAVRRSADESIDKLIPVAGVGQMPLAVMVGPGVPASVATLPDYLRWVRANPASNTYGVPGLGASPHYIGNELGRLADVPLRVAAYKGPFALEKDLVGGSLNAAITQLPGAGDAVAHPQVRILAMAGSARAPHFPDLPTLRESGYAIDVPVESLGFYMPAGTPSSKVGELQDAIAATTATPAVLAVMQAIGMLAMPAGARDYADLIAKERATWLSLVNSRNFRG